MLKHVRSFLEDIQKNFKNYPITSVFVVFYSLYCFLLVNSSSFGEKLEEYKIMFLFWFLVFPIESKKSSKSLLFVFSLLILLILVLFIHFSPLKTSYTNIHLINISILHFLSFFSWAQKDDEMALDKVINVILKAIFAIFVFTLVYGCIAFFFFLVQTLLDIEISNKIYQNLAVLTHILCMPMLYISSFDKQYSFLSYKHYGPIAKYILIPSSTLYLGILYLYFGRIVLEGEMPEGRISYLVLASCVITMLTTLASFQLLYVEKWARTYIRWISPVLILPLCINLYGVWLRIDQYGFTISRYCLLTFSLWFLGLSFWNSYKKFFSFRVGMASLYILVTLTLFIWPIGPYRISFNSQIEMIKKQFKPTTDGYTLAGSFQIVESAKKYADSIYENQFAFEKLPEAIKETYFKFESPDFEKKSEPRKVDFVFNWTATSGSRFPVTKLPAKTFKYFVSINDLSTFGNDENKIFNVFISDLNLKVLINEKEYLIPTSWRILELKQKKEYAGEFTVSEKIMDKDFFLIVTKFSLNLTGDKITKISGVLFHN